jgi:NAD(P)H dehydrogenase (quinone)
MSIVITGANGEFGRGVLNAVAALAPGERIVATVRDTGRAADLRERGLEVAPGSFDDPGALRAAFSGARAVLVNATFFGTATELRGQRVATAIRAAADAGAARARRNRLALPGWATRCGRCWASRACGIRCFPPVRNWRC